MSDSFASSTDIRTVAERFAATLDEDDFTAASRLLSQDCQYSVRGESLQGPEAILASYREASDKARRMFDRVEYSSQIVEVDGQKAIVKFWDRLEKDGHTHVFNSQQILKFGIDSRIIRIEHQDFPGEREALAAYMNQHGADEH